MRSLSDEQIKKTADALLARAPDNRQADMESPEFTGWLAEVALFVESLDNASLTRSLRTATDRTALQHRLEVERQEHRGLARDHFTQDRVRRWMLEGATGVLGAVKGAIDNGLMTELSVRIASEIYNDVLAEADRLVAERHLPCAAMLARVGLESGLRRLATRHNIPGAATDKASAVNLKLRQANVPLYTLATQQSVDGLLAIGNAFVHNTPDAAKYTEIHVANLISDVRRFLGQHGV